MSDEVESERENEIRLAFTSVRRAVVLICTGLHAFSSVRGPPSGARKGGREREGERERDRERERGKRSRADTLALELEGEGQWVRTGQWPLRRSLA
eukprot:3763141-Rhodomonas_salina.1